MVQGPCGELPVLSILPSGLPSQLRKVGGTAQTSGVLDCKSGGRSWEAFSGSPAQKPRTYDCRDQPCCDEARAVGLSLEEHPHHKHLAREG